MLPRSPGWWQMRLRYRVICLPWGRLSRHLVPFSPTLPRVFVSNFGYLFDNSFLIWLRGRRRSHVGGLASHVDVTTRPQPVRAIAPSYTGSQPTFNIRLVITCRIQGGH